MAPQDSKQEHPGPLAHVVEPLIRVTPIAIVFPITVGAIMAKLEGIEATRKLILQLLQPRGDDKKQKNNLAIKRPPTAFNKWFNEKKATLVQSAEEEGGKPLRPCSSMPPRCGPQETPHARSATYVP